MTTKKSFSCISGLLVKNDLKRFWHIPAACLLMLVFLCGVPLFSLYGTKWMCEVGFIPFEIGSIRGFLRSVVIAVLAVSSAVCVFSYLHGKSSASASFSLPFSRKTIFRSHALAGWILSVTPVITAGILFAVTFLIKIKSGRLILYANNPPDVRLSYFEVLMMMLIWTSALLIIVTFTYCACVLAAVISGTVFTHILLALFFNGIAPATVFFANQYMIRFLKGLPEAPVTARGFSPFTNLYMQLWGPNAKILTTALVFLVAAAFFLFLSGFLFKRIRPEREGDAVVFRPVGEVVCALFAFIGMSLTAFIAEGFAFTDSTALFLLFGLIGSLLFYAVARMVLDKGIHIFHKKALQTYCVFLAAAAVFCAFTVFDISGYEKRIPKTEEILSCSIEGGIAGSLGETVEFSGAEKEVTALHKALIENENDLADSDIPETRTNLAITYHLKNGKTMVRAYAFNLHCINEVRSCYETLYYSVPYRKAVARDTKQELNRLKRIDDLFYTARIDDTYTYTVKKHHDAFLKELKEAIMKDTEERSFHDQLLLNKVDQKCWDIWYTFHEEKDSAVTVTYPIYITDEHALKVIEKYKPYLEKYQTL